MADEKGTTALYQLILDNHIPTESWNLLGHVRVMTSDFMGTTAKRYGTIELGQSSRRLGCLYSCIWLRLVSVLWLPRS